MVAYAGVGARQTPMDVLQMMRLIGAGMAKKGYTCNTGAAKGADQAFAEGAAIGYGQIQLFVPWPSYEQDWVRTLNTKVDIHVLQAADKEAYQSVYDYHPAAHRLSGGVIKLHARNFCIMRGVSLVICWTPEGKVTGGTGQAIRIATDQGIPVHNLGHAQTYVAYKERLQTLGYL